MDFLDHYTIFNFKAKGIAAKIPNDTRTKDIYYNLPCTRYAMIIEDPFDGDNVVNDVNIADMKKLFRLISYGIKGHCCKHSILTNMFSIVTGFKATSRIHFS